MSGLLSSYKKKTKAAMEESKAKKAQAEKDARDAEEKAKKEAREKEERDAKIRADLERIAKASPAPVKSKPIKAARIVPFNPLNGSSGFDLEFRKRDLATDTKRYNLEVEEDEKFLKDLFKLLDTDFERFIDTFLRSPYYTQINKTLFLKLVTVDNLKLLAGEFLKNIQQTKFYREIKSHPFTNDSDDEVLIKSLESTLEHIHRVELHEATENFTKMDSAIDLKMKILTLQKFPDPAQGETRSERDFGDAFDFLETHKTKPMRQTYDELDTELKRYTAAHKPMLFLIFKINVIEYFLEFKRLISTRDEVYALLKRIVSGRTTLYEVLIDVDKYSRRNLKELEIVPNTDKPFTPVVETFHLDSILTEGIEKYKLALTNIYDDYTTDAHIGIAATQFHKLFQKDFYARVQSLKDEDELRELIVNINKRAGFDEYKKRVKEFQDLYKRIGILSKHPETLTMATSKKLIDSLADSYKRIHNLYPIMMKSFVECKIIALKISEGITVNTVDSIIEILKDERYNDIRTSFFVNPYDVSKIKSQYYSSQESEPEQDEVAVHIMVIIKKELSKSVPSLRASEIFRNMVTDGLYEDIEKGFDIIEADNIIRDVNQTTISVMLIEYKKLLKEYTAISKSEESEELKILSGKLVLCILKLIAGYVFCEIVALYIAKGVVVNTPEGVHSLMIDSFRDIINPRFLHIYDTKRIQTLKFVSMPRPTKSATIDYARLTEQLNRLKIFESKMYQEVISENESEVIASCLRIKQICKTKSEMLEQLNGFKSALADDVVKYEAHVDKYREMTVSEIIPSAAVLKRAELFFKSTLKDSMKKTLGMASICSYIIYKHAYWGQADPSYEKLIALANDRYPLMNILQVHLFSRKFNDNKQAIDRPLYKDPTRLVLDRNLDPEGIVLDRNRNLMRTTKFQAVGEENDRFYGPNMSLEEKWKVEDGAFSSKKPFTYARPNTGRFPGYTFNVGKTIKKLITKTKKGTRKGRGKKQITRKYR